MVKYRSASLDATFAALSDPTRRAIFASLAKGNLTVSDLATPHDMTLPAVMKHVAVLENAGLLRREKRGRTVWCRLNAAPLKEAADWMTRYREFWEAQFDALADYLEASQKTEETTWAIRRKPSKRSSSAASSRRRGKRSSARGPTRRR